MVFMAMLFLLEMQDKWELKALLLTISDVREIFEVIMPKRKVTDKEILKLIRKKHKAWDSAKLSHHRRGRESDKVKLKQSFFYFLLHNFNN
ncbi:Uncharacterised protein [uncultured archaeon]|nr:Uncharacterised protein [uncultured archaeon]